MSRYSLNSCMLTKNNKLFRQHFDLNQIFVRWVKFNVWTVFPYLFIFLKLTLKKSEHK